MNKYRTIKDLVLDTIHNTDGKVDYDTITRLVKTHFPQSKWNKSHWAWYRSQIKAGKIKTHLSKDNIKMLCYVRTIGDNSTIKHLGDPILNNVKQELTKAANGDATLYFKLNRWVYSRLLQTEIQVKRPIKQALWDAGIRACQFCGKEFGTIKGVEIHRKNSELGYSIENCQLLCRPCHQTRNAD